MDVQIEDEELEIGVMAGNRLDVNERLWKIRILSHRLASWGFAMPVLLGSAQMLKFSAASENNIKADYKDALAGEWSLWLSSYKHTYLAREDP